MSFSRGIDPIWWVPDLVGNPTDDTYYLFTLSNIFPYIPVPIYKDFAGTTSWSDPIPFLANGTLPDNMYWNDSLVYRLEIRQGPTQDDPLIYLIENYIPGGAGGSPDNTSSNDTDNQITNPQFALINFPITGSVVSTTSTTTVAPGWDIVTSGSGSITVTRLNILGSSLAVTNPSYALSIQSTGFDTIGLRQTFLNNGALWSGEGVAVSITARVDAGTPPTISGFVTYEASDVIAPIFTSEALTADFDVYGGSALMPASVNDSLPVDATTSITFEWSGLSNTVVVTSIQLIGQDSDEIATVEYQQETIERQIDHTFHYYYNSIVMQPKESVLTGWNFGQNPWQFTTTASTNVATNAYTADQTIVVQQAYVASATGNNVAVGQAAAASNYGFQVTAVTANNQFALIQYIDPATIRPYWGYLMSSLLRLNYTNNHSTPTLNVKMRLIWNASLPATTSQTVPIASWVDGSDPVFSSGWTAITPRNDPAYNISLDTAFSALTFEGLLLPANSTSTMTLGIVIYTVGHMNATSTADSIIFDSCSLVPNDFAIASNVLSFDETLRRCQYYYQKSFPIGTLPGNNMGYAGAAIGVQASSGTGVGGPIVNYAVQMRASTVVALFNPTAASNGNIYDFTVGSSWADSTAQIPGGSTGVGSVAGFYTVGTAPSTTGHGSAVQWTANAKLG